MRPAATKCCYLIWIGYIRPTEKQEPKKVTKMKKRFWKSEFDDSYTLWASPRRPPWKNGPWNHVNNEVCAQVAISSARDAPKLSKCYYLHAFWKKFMQRKKGEKSEIEQNICVLLIKMHFCITEPQFLSQMRLGHQVTTTKGGPCGHMVLQRQNEG